MLNLTDCLLKWSYLISIFSFDNNDVPQLVEKIIHFSEEDASEQYLVRGGKVFEIKVSIHQFEGLRLTPGGYLLVEHLLRGGLLVGSSVLLSSDIELQEVNSGG